MLVIILARRSLNRPLPLDARRGASPPASIITSRHHSKRSQVMEKGKLMRKQFLAASPASKTQIQEESDSTNLRSGTLMLKPIPARSSQEFKRMLNPINVNVASPISRPVPDTQTVNRRVPRVLLAVHKLTHRGQGGWPRACAQGTHQGTHSAPKRSHITNTHHTQREGGGKGVFQCIAGL